jgi:hypothetical protein
MSAPTWRTKNGTEIPIPQLTNGHLRQIARMLVAQPRLRGHQALRKELLRRGMDKHLRPAYPNL